MGKRKPQPPVDVLVKAIADTAAAYPEEFAEMVDMNCPPVWESPEDRLRWVGSQVAHSLPRYATGLAEWLIKSMCAEVDYVALGKWWIRTYR